ncbi:MAG: phenylalanine--tRNA ligase subunit beta, partial [Gammaproteobacteria bacterium]|nr:phenylalanine--tRNA ligase subunit beta [Gammaproteobacteria bacterium]
RLSVCTVDVGSDAPLQIVCGASNVYAGGNFPVATIGTQLPGDLKIKKSKLRGEASHGMLCSGVELGIADSADGLLELDGELAPGTDITDALALDDLIIEVDLTPNRADCFSVVGVARDMAAFNGIAFAEPASEPVNAGNEIAHPVQAAPADGCPAFAARVITGIDPAAKTPVWMVEALRRSGIRPLHPVVDVTNFVMMELGQPMHAYDRGRLQGTVHARLARQGEKVTLLDGQTLELDDDVMVIADDSGAIGLAGIMGGESTAVADGTTDVLLESAFFTPQVIAGRARRYGLHTDASLRFERGVDFSQQVRALELATTLIIEIAGGVPGPLTDDRHPAQLPQRAPVILRRDRLRRVLGIELPDDTVADMFTRLGFAVEEAGDGWSVTPTAVRFDIEIEADLIEEVARLHGYDNVPDIRFAADARLGESSEASVPLERAADLLADRGYAEVITYSFVDPELQALVLGAGDELSLANPISSEMSVMRRSIWPGLISAARENRKRQQERVRLFETGSIFSSEDTETNQKKVIAGLAMGRVTDEHWDDAQPGGRSVDFFDVKADIEALLTTAAAGSKLDYVASEHPSLRPGRTAQIERDGQSIGWLGELHPRLSRKLGMAPAPLVFELDARAALSASVPDYAAVSRFPSVRRDLAVLIDESVSAADLQAVVENAAGPLLQNIVIFDVYRGDKIENGLKSVAIGLILQETSRTLTEPEIEAVTTAVIEGLSSKLNASIRE